MADAMNDPMNDPGRMPPSLWAATAPPPPGTSALLGETRADLCVVGAGYTGLSAALHAAEAGLTVVVLEAAEIGWGASGRNNGQVIPTLSRLDPDDIVAAVGADKGEPFVALIRDSASLVFDLIRRHDMQAEAAQNGWVQPAHRESRLRVSERRVAQWGRRGAPVELVDRARMAQIAGTGHWHGGWLNRSGGRINPLGFARGLAHAAARAGARIFTQSPAQTLSRDGTQWKVATPRGHVLADKLVLATHAYSNDLWPGLRTEVVPVRSYQMATAPVSDNVLKTILPEGHALSDTRGDLYFYRFDANGRLVTGGALMIGAGYDQRIRSRIAERAARVYPQLGAPTFDYLWHGYIGVNQDRIPHVHELAPGVYAWTGCNGRGVALATAIGREFARAAAGVPMKELPLPLSPVKPIAAHGLAKLLAPMAVGLFRWRDARD
jgi:glycine/D-amino acid oxidase-like deaminating enzyme